MPNQSDQNQPQPTDQSAGQPVGSAPPVISPQMDLPPLPPELSTQVTPPSEQASSVAPVEPPASEIPEKSVVEPPAGSAAPPDLPSMVGTPKKKFGGGRIIATILGLLILIGGVGGGVILTQQKQLFEQQARLCVDSGCALTTDKNGKNPTLDKSKIQKDKEGKEETVDNKPISQVYEEWKNDPKINTYLDYFQNDNSSCGRNLDTGAPVCCSESIKSSCGSAGTEVVCEVGKRKECKSSSGTHCTIDADSADCGGANVTEGEPPSTSTSPPSITASCLNVKAYDETFSSATPLTTTQLSDLKAGNKVNFCVAGTASSNIFDKAQFKVGTTVMPETTTKRPGSQDFCQSYTILSTDTTISVKAKINHVTLGWQGENF